MWTTAPRYLSGISIFYGDDITKRAITGDIAIIMGQAAKGTSTPLSLTTIDSLPAIYGTNSPLAKAAYEFWDGYSDSPQKKLVNLVTVRIGGINTVVTLPYGVTITSIDAYDGLEDDYTVFIDNTDAASFNVKIWNINGAKVYDIKNSVDANYFTVDTSAKVATGTTYGTDLDNTPLAPVSTLTTLGNLINTAPSTFVGESAPFATAVKPVGSDTTLTVDMSTVSAGLLTTIPATGNLLVTVTSGALVKKVALSYTAIDISTPAAVEFTLVGTFGKDLASAVTASQVTVKKVPGTLVKGDSQLDLSAREKYELFTNALLEIEQYVPDYIVTGGVTFDETATYLKTDTEDTLTTTVLNATATTLGVAGAATWPKYGVISVHNGTHTDVRAYTDIAVNTDGTYTLDIAPISFSLKAGIAASAITSIEVGPQKVAAANGTLFSIPTGWIPATGSVKVTDDLGAVHTIPYSAVTVDATTGVATLTVNVTSTYVASISNLVTLVPSSNTYDAGVSMCSTQWAQVTKYEIGIGYVKQTDNGGTYSFQWSDIPAADYNLAHFGYLIANFCNNAALGYNTPLASMNVGLPTAFDRKSIVSWMGDFPTYNWSAGVNSNVVSVGGAGQGLLGNAVLAGSPAYNRSALGEPSNGKYADPAFGMLLTTNGFIDGPTMKDSYGNVIDLGKFMCVGAGLTTFTNGASTSSYIDACGHYALGVLAGKPDGDGLSFSPVGGASNVSVGVIVHRNYYNNLAQLGYLVLSREKGIGWVINNANSAARKDSAYLLISTTKTLKAVMEGKRAVLSGFIGKPLNTYYYEAARTKLAASFATDVKNGLLNSFNFNLQVEDAGKAIGKLYLGVSVNPPFELTEVVLDAVIDRSIATV